MGLRVILLKRSSQPTKDPNIENPRLNNIKHNVWVTMGHFDTMYSYSLNIENKNVFSAIHEFNNSVAGINDGNSYYHPLYLLTSDDDSEFWKLSTWFMTVTRIHLSSTTTQKTDIDQLCKSIQNKRQ